MGQIFSAVTNIIKAAHDMGDKLGGTVVPAVLKKTGMSKETADEFGGMAGMAAGVITALTGTFLAIAAVAGGFGLVPGIIVAAVAAPAVTFATGVFKGGLHVSNIGDTSPVKTSVEAPSTFDAGASIECAFKNTAKPAAEKITVAAPVSQPALKS